MNNDYMSDELFAELLESMCEGRAILRSEKEASRIFEVEVPKGNSTMEDAVKRNHRCSDNDFG